MSLIKKIIIFFTLIILSSSHLFAQELEKVGKFKDWEAMVIYEPSGKVCFAQSSPKLQAPKSKKRKAKLFVTFRPEDNITNEVSVTPGYEFNNKNSVLATSGKSKFKFDIKEQGFAWIADNKIEIKMISRMKKGSRIMIMGYDQKGSQTIDDYSLLGFTKAYNAAKKACT
tara:strand:- start:83 stop:592 length:510 start_codon:yes stop_codon:yes gene_type:complete